MKRSEVLGLIRAAGYHGDTQEGTRLYLSHSVRLDIYRGAYAEGERLKREGLPCNCLACKPRSR